MIKRSFFGENHITGIVNMLTCKNTFRSIFYIAFNISSEVDKPSYVEFFLGFKKIF